MTTAKRNILFGGLGAAVALLATSFLAGIAVGYLRASGVTVDLHAAAFWGILVLSVMAMVGAMGVSVLWMRSIDEAAREAHKAAWFWGGSAGMSVGGVLMILSSLPGAETIVGAAGLFGRTDPTAYMAVGAFALMTLMLIGYGVVWAWWWLARR